MRGAGDGEAGLRLGVKQLDCRCMELVIFAMCPFEGAGCSIYGVTDDGVTDGSELASDLVCDARVDGDLETGLSIPYR